MDKVDFRPLLDQIGETTLALIENGLLPNYEPDSLEGHPLIEAGYHNTDSVYIHLCSKDGIPISVGGNITLEDDGRIWCSIEVFDMVEQEKGKYALPELISHLADHPTLGFRDLLRDPDVNFYLYKEVPKDQLLIAFLATVLAVQELIK